MASTSYLVRPRSGAPCPLPSPSRPVARYRCRRWWPVVRCRRRGHRRCRSRRRDADAAAVAVPVVGDDQNWRAAVAAIIAAGRRIRFVYEDAAAPALRQQNGDWIVEEK